MRTVSNSGALQIQTVRISVKNTTRGLSSRTLHRLSNFAFGARRAALLAFWPGLPVARWRVGALAGCRAADPPAGRAVGGLAAGRSLWDGPGRRYELRGGRRAVAPSPYAYRFAPPTSGAAAPAGIPPLYPIQTPWPRAERRAGSARPRGPESLTAEAAGRPGRPRPGPRPPRAPVPPRRIVLGWHRRPGAATRYRGTGLPLHRPNVARRGRRRPVTRARSGYSRGAGHEDVPVPAPRSPATALRLNQTFRAGLVATAAEGQYRVSTQCDPFFVFH